MILPSIKHLGLVCHLDLFYVMSAPSLSHRTIRVDKIHAIVSCWLVLHDNASQSSWEPGNSWSVVQYHMRTVFYPILSLCHTTPHADQFHAFLEITFAWAWNLWSTWCVCSMNKELTWLHINCELASCCFAGIAEKLSNILMNFSNYFKEWTWWSEEFTMTSKKQLFDAEV